MGKYVLEGNAILEINIIDKVFIPKLSLMSFDTIIHFKFQRRQSLKHGGIYLPTSLFSHN